MDSKRQKQVAELIKRNFSLVLQDEGRYIYGNSVLVTVTEVKMTPDFGTAKIYLSIYNTENKQEPILELQENYHRLRQALAYRIRKQIRRIPDLNFFLDDTIDEMYKVDALFQKLYEDKQMGSPLEETEENEEN